MIKEKIVVDTDFNKSNFSKTNQLLFMKKLLVTIIIIISAKVSFCQYPKEISPQLMQKIKTEIEKQIPAFKKSLSKQNLTEKEIEFTLDTFRIEELCSKRIEIDYSTIGMNDAMDDREKEYDKLLNKYYNKLLNLLKNDDKKTLIKAQRAWLAYRDAEFDLIGTLTNDEYSGGGTIQSNIASGAHCEMVVKRTIEIYNYYNNIITE